MFHPLDIKSSLVSGEETFVSLKPDCQSVGRTRDLRLSKQAALTTAPGGPPFTGSEAAAFTPGIRAKQNIQTALTLYCFFTDSHPFETRTTNAITVSDGVENTVILEKTRCLI